MKKSLLLLGALGLVGLAGLVVHATPCSWVAWDVYQPTCDEAGSDGAFAFNLKHSTQSDTNAQTFDYYLNTPFTPGTSVNITNGSVTPEVFSVYITGAYGPSTCSGTLVNLNDNGSFVVSAYSSDLQCSGTWTVAIKKPGQSCQP